MFKKLYHKDKFMYKEDIESCLKMQRNLNQYQISLHLLNHIKKDNKRRYNYCSNDIYNAIGRLIDNPVEPFELERRYDDYGFCHIEKYCVRIPLNKYYDISIVIKYNGYIITAWLNNKDDVHSTLDLSRYEEECL